MAAFTVHGLKNCDACRKAVKALIAEGHDAVMRDYRAEPPSDDEIASWRAAVGEDVAPNKKSATWRALDDAGRAAVEADLGPSLRDDPRLIKRPLIEGGGRIALKVADALAG